MRTSYKKIEYVVPCILDEIFVADEYMGWISDQLVCFRLGKTLDDAPHNASMEMLLFWLNPKRKDEFGWKTQCLINDLGDDWRSLIHVILYNQVQNALDGGHVTLARILICTEPLIMEQDNVSIGKIEMDFAELMNIPKESTVKTLPNTNFFLKSDVITCLRASASRITVSEWLLLGSNPNLVRNAYKFNGNKITVTVAYKNNGTKNEIYINETVRMSTVMTLFKSKLTHPPTTFTRVVHRGKNLFLSDSSKMDLGTLGIKDHDVLVAISSNNDKPRSNMNTTNQRSKMQQPTKAKKHQHQQAAAKKAKRKLQVQYGTEENDRVKHSRNLSLVFQEAEPTFKERRKVLNDLAVKNFGPKTKANNPNPQSKISVTHDGSLEGIIGKAGKVYFTVIVGHEEFLYKSSKASKTGRALSQQQCTIDLHGCSKDEALRQLNESLPRWKEVAMREHPWTVPVTIICGGGNQVLSEAVEHWIRENRNVANRPKGFA